MKVRLDSGKNTNESRFENGVLYTCGVAFHMAWIFTSMYSISQIYGNVSSISNILGGEGNSYTLLYLISAIAFLVTTLLVAINDQKLLILTRSRKFLCASTIFGAIATLIPLLSVNNEVALIVLQCVSGLGTGICSAILLLCWSIRYASRHSAFIFSCGSAGVAGGFFISVAIIRILPVPLGGIAAALMPLLECIFLVAVTPTHFTPEAATETFLPVPTDKKKIVRALVPPFVLVGIALGMLKYISAQNALINVSEGDLAIVLIMIGFGIIAIFSCYSSISKKPQWDTFLRIYAPALTCICLAISFLLEDGSVFKEFFFLFSYLMIETLLWVQFPHISHRLRISPLFLVGAARSIVATGTLAGVLFADIEPLTLQTTLAFQPISSEGVICIAAIVFLILGFAFVPKETRLRGMVADCPLVRLVAIQEDGEVDILNMQAALTTMSEKTNQESTTLEKQAVVTQPLQNDANSSDTDSTKFPDAHQSENQGALSTEQDEKLPAGKFTQRVKKVSKTFLLTERETDVLFELAKGNSPKYIQEKFVLSEATVKTHIRNIYRKLDVHKRNDLMRLIENIDAYD